MILFWILDWQFWIIDRNQPDMILAILLILFYRF